MPPRDHINNTAIFIRQKNGVTYLPHPTRGCKLDEVDFNLIDIVETFNSRCTPEQCRFAENRFRDSRLYKVCGSDAHLLRDIGKATVCFSSVDIDQLKADLLNGNFELGKMEHSSSFGLYYSTAIGIYSKHSFLKATAILIKRSIKKLLRF